VGGDADAGFPREGAAKPVRTDPRLRRPDVIVILEPGDREAAGPCVDAGRS
jgi:hypothetical protein